MYLINIVKFRAVTYKKHFMSQNDSITLFNDRAKHRLRLAARFLRQPGHKFNQGNFYNEVLRRIRTIDQSQAEKLRALSDWVEEYEN